VVDADTYFLERRACSNEYRVAGCVEVSNLPINRPTGHNPKIGLFPYRPQTSEKRRDPADSNSISALPIPAN
jgi:hypothetical protein